MWYNKINMIAEDKKMAENSDKSGEKFADGGSKNIILYGPPGTGKTYNTVRKAVEIIRGKAWADKDYSEVKNEYDKLVDEKRIRFVTFHQSYGYEEFIEGIKPKTKNDRIIYEVEAGIFRDFCDKAKDAVPRNESDYGFNSSPAIWKVSLKGTGKNEIRDYCLENDCIRVGYDQEGEDGKRVLNALINKMRKGDIILSCYSEKAIDAIGVVTGDYEKKDNFDSYKHFRGVSWIYKTSAEKGRDIFDLNGKKKMTLSTIYRLNSITQADVLKIVEGDDNEVKNPSAKTSYGKDKYVFIIDEINRGNISKIFGELITLIEDNKRDGASEAACVTLPYSQKTFSVPDNVYILGTMNTADRSIAAIDTALRRRFAFEEMMPDCGALVNSDKSPIVVDGIDIAAMLKVINERIEILYDREHTVGHAYFMPLRDKKGAAVKDIADIFRNKIIPLLQEYFYEDYGKIRLVLGDNQKEKVNLPQFIVSEDIPYNSLFGSAEEYELGEKNKKYSLNAEAFYKKEAYIGIYSLTDGGLNNGND